MPSQIARRILPSARVVAETPIDRAPEETDSDASGSVANFLDAMGLESLYEVTYKPSISPALALIGLTVACIFFLTSWLACNLLCSCLSKVCEIFYFPLLSILKSPA